MKRDDPDAFVVPAATELPAPAADVIRVLAPLVTPARLARMKAVLAARTRRLVVVLEEISDPHNASAVMRSADAFGVQEVHVIAGEHEFRAARGVAKGAERWLDIVRHASATECIAALRARGYETLVAAMDGALRAEELAGRERVAVVFGNEHRGASEAVRSGADGTFAVPMVGFVESLNVSVAAAVTLHAATRGAGGDLGEADRDTILARWLLDDVKEGARLVSERAIAGDREGT